MDGAEVSQEAHHAMRFLVWHTVTRIRKLNNALLLAIAMDAPGGMEIDSF